MFLSYDGMVFDMLFLDGWSIEADMSSDGCDFLRWHNVIDVTCVLNPAVTAANRFPLQRKFKDQINSLKKSESSARLRTKAASPDAKKMKSGQLPGEDVKKRKQRQQQTRNVLSLLGGGTANTVSIDNTQVNPDGSISYIPALLDVQGLPIPINNQYEKWLRLLPSVPFVPPLGGLIGPVFTNVEGGTTSDTSPNTFPGTTLGSANLPPTVHSSSPFVPDGFKEAAAEALKKAGNAAAQIASISGGLLGLGLTVAGVHIDPAASIKDEINKQLTSLGDLLGITKDDIFGNGRQPGPVKFAEPPVKHKLNDPPPQQPGVNSAGNSVPITFVELTNRLANPRRQLAIWLNSGPDGAPEYMLLSPYPGMTVDAVSGPVCRIMHMPAIHGNVTGILKLRFETWIAPPPELYNAKQIVKAYDQEFYHTLRSLGGTSANLKSQQAAVSAAQLTSKAAKAVIGATGGASNSTTGTPSTSPAGGIFDLIMGPFKLINQMAMDNAQQQAANGGRKLANFLIGTPPIISNRWTMRQVPDPVTCLNTTVIEGVAHFRADVLQAYRITADQLRPFFMHPIPYGYKRQPPEVVQNSDGTSVNYKIVDVQQMMNNPGGAQWGISQVQVKQHFGYNSPLDYVRSPFSPFPGMGQGMSVEEANPLGGIGIMSAIGRMVKK